MRIQVRMRGIDHSAEIADHAQRRVHHYLSRFGRQVTGVFVRLTDVNGPRGGRDKRCHVTVTGPVIGTLQLAETDGDISSGVEGALARLSQTVGRTIQRARETQTLRTARRNI